MSELLVVAICFMPLSLYLALNFKATKNKNTTKSIFGNLIVNPQPIKTNLSKAKLYKG